MLKKINLAIIMLHTNDLVYIMFCFVLLKINIFLFFN